MFSDRTLKCSDCGMDFLFSAQEQQFWEERNFRSPPRRCKECRKKRRDSEGAGGAGGNGFSPRSDGGGHRSHGGGGSSGPRESFPATCSACGAETTVPFKPDPARATFCRACYAQRRKK